MSLDEKDGPFGNAALAYIKAGWPEVLPIWKGGVRDKQPMVRGYHGREGTWPDETTFKLWSRRYARANLALRLPRWIVGLDVDHYSDKYGGDSLAELQDELGPLPGTIVSTSRDDGVSGIRLFMVPGDYVGSAWPSQAAVDIDMITWYERYVICAPSVHKSGNVYRWYRQHGTYREMREVRNPYKLCAPTSVAALPAEWCEYLAGLAGAGSSGTKFDGSAAEWLAKYGGGEPCRHVRDVTPKWLARFNGGSAHPAAEYAISQAVYAACDGHIGINSALWDVRAKFIETVSSRGAGERRRGEGKAVSEWRSLMTHIVTRYGGEVASEDAICDELEGF